MKLETVDAFKKIKNNGDFINLSDEDLKDLQRELLIILNDFDQMCKEEGIRYALGGGSALGAIRHKGFIPWDDDVDINITRANYDRLYDTYKKHLSDRYWLHTPEQRPDLGLGFARLRKKGTILKAREDLNNDECGIYIDIFIVENTFDNPFLRYCHGFLSMLTGFLLSCRNFYKNRSLYGHILGKNSAFMIKKTIGFLLSAFSVDFYTKQWNFANKMCMDNESSFVTIPCGRRHFFKELYRRKDMETTFLTSFEDYEFPVYIFYDKYLTNLYGDYMKLPKETDRETHIVLDYKINGKA